MYIRKRKAFRELVGILRDIENDLDRLDLVLELNTRVLELVIHAEQAIKRHKTTKTDLKHQLKTSRPSKADAKALKTKLKRVDSYISAQRDQVFIWKCFGDALAFLYLDPFSIKHVFFDVNDYRPKQDAGALNEKKGLENEVSALEEVIALGVPAVLCDLTNVVRHGDICMLGGNDPSIIEVKSNPKLNARAKRQIDQLNKISDFLTTDVAQDFRGSVGPTYRETIGAMPRYHTDALNTCLSHVATAGHAIANPEPGVFYIAMRVDNQLNVQDVFSQVDAHEPELYDLNQYKNNREWGPYIPFFLSIKDTSNLLDFIEGRTYILILAESHRLTKLLEVNGWECRYRPNHEYPIQLFHKPTFVYGGLSQQLLSRVALEFLSLESIAEMHFSTLDRIIELSQQQGASNKEDTISYLIEKFGPEDEWVKMMKQK